MESISSKSEKENNSVPTSSPTSLPPNWIRNVIHKKDEKATKSDDALIPVHFWNNALRKLLNIDILSDAHTQALEIVRDFIVDKVWRPSIIKDFCSYLRCKTCFHSKVKKLFSKGINTVSLNSCSNCTKYKSKQKVHLGVVFDKKENAYVWKQQGKKLYKKLYNIFHRKGKGKEAVEVDKDVEAAKDCFERVIKASTWKWDGGSRLFFWRWGKFKITARDGAPTFVQGKLPRCREKQSVPKDTRTLGLVQKKLSDVQRKGYITKESADVVSVTSFFDVP